MTGVKTIIDFNSQKKVVDSLKTERNLMWSERFNDKPKAEGVAMDNYHNLGVERGTIIHATRDFKALDFKEILQNHSISQPERFIQPTPSVGGWGKFIKQEIRPAYNSKQKTLEHNSAGKNSDKKQNKSNSGWLHIS
jgi:hypothetical protein